MSNVEWSEKLQRKIRKDSLAEVGILSGEMAIRAIREKRYEDAVDLIEYLSFEAKNIDTGMLAMAEKFITYIATNMGESHVENVWRSFYHQRVVDWLPVTVTAEDRLFRIIEYARAHFGNFTVTEEADRYVMKNDPCGGLHRLWRNGGAVGLTQKAYPWSWGRTGVPYYCAHCRVLWEILPIEMSGYPMRITLSPEKPQDPCVTYYFKKQELIPEKYFERIGKMKTKK